MLAASFAIVVGFHLLSIRVEQKEAERGTGENVPVSCAVPELRVIDVSIKRGPYGTRVAVVDAQYELLGEFLAVEATAWHAWPYRYLDPSVQSVQSRETEAVLLGGDAYTLTIYENEVEILPKYDEPPPRRLVLELHEFRTALNAWLQLLEASRSRKKKK